MLCETENFFALLPPDMPLRIEVMNAIYFEALNLRTYHTVLPRIEFGLKISCVLDGYWRKDEWGRIRRVACLENGLALTAIGDQYLQVYIDLQYKTFPEVQALYQSIARDSSCFADHCVLY